MEKTRHFRVIDRMPDGQSMTLNRNLICSPFLRLSVQPAMRCVEMKMTHWLGMSESVPVVRERIEEASLMLRNPQRQKPEPPPPPHCVLMFNRMNDDRSFFTSPPFFFLSSSTPSFVVLQSEILRTKGRLRLEEQRLRPSSSRRPSPNWGTVASPSEWKEGALLLLSHSLNKNRAERRNRK